MEAVAKAVSAPDIAIIQGPPGTGKTTVIAEIIWQQILKKPDSKILLTSQTNLAVDNALERLQGRRGIRPVRIQNASTEKEIGIEAKGTCWTLWKIGVLNQVLRMKTMVQTFG